MLMIIDEQIIPVYFFSIVIQELCFLHMKGMLYAIYMYYMSLV